MDKNFWHNKRVLVTGAAGFIGSHLCEALVERGAQVTALVKYSSSGFVGNLRFTKNIDQMKLVFGNIEDPQLMENFCEGQDVVLHLAALIGIPYSYKAAQSYITTNVQGTFNVLHAAKVKGVNKVVVTSTSETYGTARQVPINEEHPLQGQSPYSASKIGADKIAESMQLSFNLPVATIRPFNTYGPRQSARAVIPTIIAQAIANKSVKLGSLDPIRDFCFVGDTVEGFLRVAESPASIGQVINIGTGKAVSIGETCELIKKVLGFDFKIVTEETRIRPENSEVMRLLCDYSKAQKLLSWEPTVSLEKGLAETASFIKANLGLYQAESYVV